MSEKSIIMMGTPEFAVASLNALHSAGISIKAVVTAPDRPAGRGKKMRASAMSNRAVELGIPTLKPTNLKDQAFIATLRDLNADLFVVVAFRMLPEEVWSMPPLGTVNLHGSLLPDYRGAAPINRAIMNGESKTGATTFFIRQKIDTGDIIDSTELAIGANETAGELHDRMMVQGAELLTDTVRRIFAGDVSTIEQNTLDRGSLKEAPKIHTEDRRIDWSLPAEKVHNHVRGLSPYPGAWTVLRSHDRTKKVKIMRTRLCADTENRDPGTILLKDGCFLVYCAQGVIQVDELQVEGKKAMSAGDYLRGAQWGNNERFE